MFYMLMDHDVQMEDLMFETWHFYETQHLEIHQLGGTMCILETPPVKMVGLLTLIHLNMLVVSLRVLQEVKDHSDGFPNMRDIERYR